MHQVLMNKIRTLGGTNHHVSLRVSTTPSCLSHLSVCHIVISEMLVLIREEKKYQQNQAWKESICQTELWFLALYNVLTSLWMWLSSLSSKIDKFRKTHVSRCLITWARPHDITERTITFPNKQSLATVRSKNTLLTGSDHLQKQA